MRKISIADVTVKLSEKDTGFSLSFREKIELCKLLDRLKTDVIELHPIANPKKDSLLIKSIASAVEESVVAVPVGLDAAGVETAWNAVREAKHPRLQVQVPVSDVQMEYLAGKKPAAMHETVEVLVKACAALCSDVEFVAEDATRSDPAFLREIIGTAIAAGATAVTVCDTAGTSLADEFASFIRGLYADIPALSSIRLGVACSNAMSLADACAVAAIPEGVSELKTAAYGTDAARLANVVRIITAKPEVFRVECGVNTTQLKRITEQIRWMCQTDRSKNSPFDNGVQNDQNLTLNVHDDLSAVCKAVAMLGYTLSDEDCQKVYEAFQQIAAKKESVGVKELDAIVASAALQVPPTFRLDSYVINTGNTISATAHLTLFKNGVQLQGISLGDGPIDAAFLAIEQIVGHHFELDDFQIQAVTEGREAMGESVVKLRSGGKLYSGRGISTDIVGASIHAYINALNKIVYEESVN